MTIFQWIFLVLLYNDLKLYELLVKALWSRFALNSPNDFLPCASIISTNIWQATRLKLL